MITTEKQANVLQDLWPDKASYRPGEPATIQVSLRNDESSAQSVQLELRLCWLDQHLSTVEHTTIVPPGATLLSLPISLPAIGFRGYGVDLRILDPQGVVLARGSTALDVLDDWRQAPRYGFLSDFAPDDPAATESVDTLARYHINIVQFYDWMWRHYQLMPPTDDFQDALGRALSLRTVREKTAACRARSMACYGYGAVYGAEPDYALEHPDEVLYDAADQPYSLVQLFYIMNIHEGNPWRPRILAALVEAVRAVPFDGLHLDQYGFPQQEVFGPAPARVPYDLAQDFPPFIDDARAAVRQVRPDSGVIFNAVGNWPIETVAPTTQDATYIEVWTPYDAYSDLQSLILEARRLAPTKQVILAAYLKPLLEAPDTELPAAEAATRLASAAIWANGGFHLLMGERDAALCDPYYPKYATMRPDFARVMRRYYDFVVRYENLLSDPRLTTVSGSANQRAVQLSGASASASGEAGAVWTILRQQPGFTTVTLINFTAANDTNWNEPKPIPSILHNLQLEFQLTGGVTTVFAASPDGLDQASVPLAPTLFERDSEQWIRVIVPQLEYWTLIAASS